MRDGQKTVEELKRWAAYGERYRLPAWEEIPDLGLYMEQVVGLLTEYLNVPQEAREEPIVAGSTINNYVRKKVMPKPVKKRYYRRHIAYLIIIYTMKYCLSIPTLQCMIPIDLPEAEVERIYSDYVVRHRAAVAYFVSHVQTAAADLADHRTDSTVLANSPEQLVTTVAVFSGLARALAETLLKLNASETPGSAPAAAEIGADGETQTRGGEARHTRREPDKEE